VPPRVVSEMQICAFGHDGLWCNGYESEAVVESGVGYKLPSEVAVNYVRSAPDSVAKLFLGHWDARLIRSAAPASKNESWQRQS